MKTTLYVIVVLLLLVTGSEAKPRPRTTYGLPRMTHRKQTLRNYRLESKKQFSPCKTHRKRKSKSPFDSPFDVPDCSYFPTVR
jgi:hypothetical protein